MTTLATTSSLRDALTPEALTRARRRLLTVSPDTTGPNAVIQGSLTDEQLRLLAASDWVPPRIAALDANTIATADAITRALLAESVRETLERRLAAERPHGTYDDTRAGHDAFSRGVTDDYDHGNHHLVRASLRPADPGLAIRAGLTQLGLPDTDAPIIDELVRASNTNPIMRVLADAALVDRDRRAQSRRSHGHRRSLLQRLLRRARRVRVLRHHHQWAQPTPIPRPAQRRRARALPRHCARTHRQAAQPGAGPHGTFPPTPGRPNRHGAPAHA